MEVTSRAGLGFAEVVVCRLCVCVPGKLTTNHIVQIFYTTTGTRGKELRMPTATACFDCTVRNHQVCQDTGLSCLPIGILEGPH